MLVLEYKIKAKPSQCKAIDEAIRTVQFIRNKCIRYWMDASRDAKINFAALSRYSTELRNEFKFVKDLNSMAVQASAERGWLAIFRFYDNCKSKKPGKKGFPRFQKDNRSVEYKTSGWKLDPTKRRITITDKKGVGELKLLGKWDIHTYPVKSIKRVRLVRRADGYYCQFAVDVECLDIQPMTGQEIGLDVGLESFYTDSNGHHEPNPKFLKTADSDINHAQRQIYKKKKGSSFGAASLSNNRRRARKRYSKKHLRVSRQRNEHAKKLARNVCQSNDLIAYEDLMIRNMVKCHNRAKSISDASWYQFRLWIEHFARKFGKTAIAVAPHNTSQECCICGKKVKKELKVRVHSCTCGLTIHRDINAAINILLRAKSRDGQSQSNALGVAASTLVGTILLGQAATLIKESPSL
jgi:putative transposase